MFDIKKEVIDAKNRISDFVRETPLDYSEILSQKLNCKVYLKCENLQYTGSFKVRGAFNKLLGLTASQLEQGIIAASTGNHGAAVAFALKKLKAHGIIFLPENTSTTKIENIRHYHDSIKFYGNDCVQTELHAIDYAKELKKVYISPYNDYQLIAGQGTIGLELSQQWQDINVVLVPVGGGGLIAGIAGYLKSIFPKIKVIGCLPENSPVMAESIKTGHIIEMESQTTLSDATAGGIEPGAVTFELCQKWVDDYILVSEQEIKDAIVTLLSTQHFLIEGAAGVALAALLKSSQTFRNKNVAVVLSGANISLETLKTVLV